MTREELNEEIQKEIEKEQRSDRRKKIIKFSIKCLFFIFIFLILFYSYTTYVSTVKITIKENRIVNEKIPDAFNGLKIIHLSDLHYGSTMLKENVKEIRQLSNIRKPDIVVFTGDLIAKDYQLTSEEQEILIKELKKINASLGKYAILGDEDTEKVSTIFNQSDFIILRNEYDFIYEENSAPILLIGISSQKKEQDIEKAYAYFQQETHNSNIFTITLLHEPDVVDDILSAYPTDLFLAGHSHNGDIRIPFTQKALKKKQGALKYNQEFYQINDSKLYISSGLGTESGIRLFCRPSINFFRLSNH